MVQHAIARPYYNMARGWGLLTDRNKGTPHTMNELPETLNRALTSPLVLTFTDDDEARSWQFRALNYIRRRAPHLSQLMITRRDNEVRVRVPSFKVQSDAQT